MNYGVGAGAIQTVHGGTQIGTLYNKQLIQAGIIAANAGVNIPAHGAVHMVVFDTHTAQIVHDNNFARTTDIIKRNMIYFIVVIIINIFKKYQSIF